MGHPAGFATAVIVFTSWNDAAGKPGEMVRICSACLKSGLSETWDIDRPARHSHLAVLARLVFVFLIYNAPLVRKAKPSPPRLCRTTAADAQMRSGNQFGGSDDHCADSLRFLLCADGAGAAETARATPAEDRARLGGREIAEGVMREIDSG
jgi:hypothetical protein